MATRDVFSDEELAQLRGFPEINRVELIRHFTLTGADEAFLRKFRTGRNVLGAAVQLCTLPWLGFVPDQAAAAPAAAAGRLWQRLDIPVGELRGYGERGQTRTERGENLHALRRNLAYAGEGAIRRRYHEQQSEQMWCLTVATNAIVCWSTEYHGLGVAALRRDGRGVDDEVLAHIWPAHHENVHFYGTHSVDIDGELAKLDADGYRPLRLARAAAVPE